MSSSAIINESMTLDEKLAAIDAMMATAVENASKSDSKIVAPLDPADLTMCLGCQ